MKLFEIISVAPEKLTPRLPPKSLPTDDYEEGGDVEVLGQGSFATAYSNKQEPGTVKKIVSRSVYHDLGGDPYFQYVTMLLKNNRMASNPYFPKIYDVHPYKQKDGYHYTVDMERLHRIQDLEPEEITAIGNKLFFDYERLALRVAPGDKQEYQKYRVLKQRQTYKKDHEQLGRLINLIKQAFNHNRNNNIKVSIRDPQFKQAVMLIHGLRETIYGLFVDIHEYNIMVRRGPGGAHLVFTDPVA